MIGPSELRLEVQEGSQSAALPSHTSLTATVEGFQLNQVEWKLNPLKPANSSRYLTLNLVSVTFKDVKKKKRKKLTYCNLSFL